MKIYYELQKRPIQSTNNSVYVLYDEIVTQIGENYVSFNGDISVPIKTVEARKLNDLENTIINDVSQIVKIVSAHYLMVKTPRLLLDTTPCDTLPTFLPTTIVIGPTFLEINTNNNYTALHYTDYTLERLIEIIKCTT
jgi:hypothetical protein